MTDSQKLDMLLSAFQGFQPDMGNMKTEMKEMKADMQDVKTDMKNMKTDMQNMKTDMQNMKADMQNMKADMQDMKTDMQNMKTDIQDMKTDIQDTKHRVTAIELHLENTTDRNIQLLAESHLTLVNKLNEAIKVSSNTYLYEIKVNLLTERVDKLEQEVSGLKNGETVCK